VILNGTGRLCGAPGAPRWPQRPHPPRQPPRSPVPSGIRTSWHTGYRRTYPVAHAVRSLRTAAGAGSASGGTTAPWAPPAPRSGTLTPRNPY